MNEPGESLTGDDERSAQIRKAVGIAIARKREQAGLSQEAVAERLGIVNLSVSRMERGVHAVTADRLIMLAEIFGCRADELLLPGSSRMTDQVGELAATMETFTASERTFVMEFVRNFSSYKQQK
ncbi:MAG: helix-turn-helix transcriptional regulator [Pseudomonadota bacterium]